MRILPGNLAWEPCLVTSSWEPSLGTLRSADLAAPTCSVTFVMAEDPKLTLLGEKNAYSIYHQCAAHAGAEDLKN